MTPECFILLARLCLPPQTDAIDVHRSQVSTVASVRAMEAELHFELETDVINTARRGLQPVCIGSECVYFRVRRLPGKGEFRQYTLVWPGEDLTRHLDIRAADNDALNKIVQALSLQLRSGAMVPLPPAE